MPIINNQVYYPMQFRSGARQENTPTMKISCSRNDQPPNFKHPHLPQVPVRVSSIHKLLYEIIKKPTDTQCQDRFAVELVFQFFQSPIDGPQKTRYSKLTKSFILKDFRDNVLLIWDVRIPGLIAFYPSINRYMTFDT